MPGLFAGSLSVRVTSALTDCGIQYAMNSTQYGLGTDNLKSINITSVFGNFIMPNAGLSQAIFANSFKYTAAGSYEGVSSNASGTYIMANIILNYGGNTVGKVHGQFIGGMVGNSAQNVFDLYSNIYK